MGNETTNQNTRQANQAWRKKPRKFAPKSRLGCKTCKIRRVKCDLSRPLCSKCQSTGRTCDGYGEQGSADNNNNNNGASRIDGHRSTGDCSPSQNLRPLLILPATDPSEALAMGFFEQISIGQLNEYQPCGLWRSTLMFFSQTVPSVRHAATALSLMHRRYLDCSVSNSLQTPEDERCRPREASAWSHYSRAIQLLLAQETADGIETTAITLLVCYLLFCFDHLSGGDVQAMKHLRGGVEISRGVRKATPLGNGTLENTALAGAHALITQVTRQIRRLDMQAALFIIDWTPADLQDTLVSSQPPLRGGVFTTLGDAADHLQVLVARAMKIYWTEEQPLLTADATPDALQKSVLLGQLQTWWALLLDTLQATSHVTSPHQKLEPLLRLQYTIVTTLLNISEPVRELAYDRFLPEFQQCVALAGDVHNAYYSKSAGPAFTPEIGLLPVLYIVGVKCRHPVIRRRALSILRRQPIREALWDSVSAAAVVERVISIEEGDRPSNGRGMQAMGDIAAWQRVENLSWMHFGRAGALDRVDIRYKMCGREGWRSESLAICSPETAHH
ncbi:hypothetical protein PpBr36_09126 [Pyricularia pennisetigena]|uniref:hypothetical protein n=1 Tax=Pyricularia pennisetigena TaxID=1578925 RepID=UPI0011528EE3|nr:hypothetical protein PpBr36_09126 [Pyricularia pennisetigena]TLS23811.1 hypothetical protein PpBr36_09126 [Pyricularia pennisetigena]